MKRWLKGHIKRHMIRPIVYKTFSRFLTALALALLWNRYINAEGLLSMNYAYTILGCFFLAMAWFSYLRLDGIKLPEMKWPRFSAKKRAYGPFSPMSDHFGEEIVSFAELPEDERDSCSLLANVICSAVFLLWSFA